MVSFYILDRAKIYNSDYMDPDISPSSLQRKVQFDLRLYFARRGCENMEKMGKDHFKLEFDKKQELWFVMKSKDELTKNHKEIGEIISGLMPENRDDKMCPVRSYRKYMEHLNPENKFLWQKPLENKKGNVWYGLQYYGKNTLGKFMGEVSLHCNLSRHYTNHSIRVTGITVLTRMKFSPSEIMSVSGHKSVQSLTNYQRTKPKQKIQMGDVLHQSMRKTEETIQVNKITPAIEYPKQNAVSIAQPKLNAVIPYEPEFDQEVPEFDLLAILNEVENAQQQHDDMAVSTTTTNTVLNNVPRSMFSNCSIGNITFNIQK